MIVANRPTGLTLSLTAHARQRFAYRFSGPESEVMAAEKQLGEMILDGMDRAKVDGDKFGMYYGKP